MPLPAAQEVSPLLSDDVTNRVRLTLSQARVPAFQKIEIGAESGKVILSGELPSYYLKQLVQTIAASVDGVRRLENRILVVREMLERSSGLQKQIA